jgi:hypothetical protein
MLILGAYELLLLIVHGRIYVLVVIVCLHFVNLYPSVPPAVAVAAGGLRSMPY